MAAQIAFDVLDGLMRMYTDGGAIAPEMAARIYLANLVNTDDPAQFETKVAEFNLTLLARNPLVKQVRELFERVGDRQTEDRREKMQRWQSASELMGQVASAYSIRL